MTPPKKPAKNSPAAAPAEARPLPEKGIGGRIKEARLRKENDLTIEALSRLSKLVDPVGQGIAQQTIVRYEKGDVLPGARELRVLCDALNVSADWLIMGQERKGVVDLDVALAAFSRVLKARLTAENPLAYPATSADVVRPMLLAKAKEPQPRK